MTMRFTKFKVFRLFVENEVGLTKASLKLLEEGYNKILEEGEVYICQTDDFKTPLNVPMPKHRSLDK